MGNFSPCHCRHAHRVGSYTWLNHLRPERPNSSQKSGVGSRSSYGAHKFSSIDTHSPLQKLGTWKQHELCPFLFFCFGLEGKSRSHFPTTILGVCPERVKTKNFR